MRVLSKLWMFILPVILTGCVTLSTTRQYTENLDSFYQHAGTDKDFRLVVVGNPFDETKGQVDENIRRHLQRELVKFRANVTLTPGPSEVKPYKVVVAFNPPTFLQADAACADPSKATGAASDAKLRIWTLFCEAEILAEVTASMDATKSVNAADVQRALVQSFYQVATDQRTFKRSFDEN